MKAVMRLVVISGLSIRRTFSIVEFKRNSYWSPCWCAASWILNQYHTDITNQDLSCTRCINVVNNQATTSAELFGSCGAAAAETNSCGAPSAVTLLAAHRTLGDLQAGRSYVQRATHGDTGALEQSHLYITVSLHIECHLGRRLVLWWRPEHDVKLHPHFHCHW